VLIPGDINRLSIGPTTLDFGTVSAISTTTKYFAVTNELKDSILAGGSFRTNTRPTLILILLLRVSVRAFTLKVPGKSCSDLGSSACSQ